MEFQTTLQFGWNRGEPLFPSSEDGLQGSLAWTNRPQLTVGLPRQGLNEEAIAKSALAISAESSPWQNRRARQPSGMQRIIPGKIGFSPSLSYPFSARERKACRT